MINTINNFLAEIDKYINNNNEYDDLFDDYTCQDVRNDVEVFEKLMSKSEYRFMDKTLVDNLIHAAYKSFYGKPENKEKYQNLSPEKYVLCCNRKDATYPEGGDINFGFSLLECSADEFGTREEIAVFTNEQEALEELKKHKNSFRFNGKTFGTAKCVDVEIYKIVAICGEEKYTIFRAEWSDESEGTFLSASATTIKELREKSGMTQKSFSEYFKMSKRTVESWEVGRTRPPRYLIELMEYKLINEGIIEKTCDD